MPVRLLMKDQFRSDKRIGQVTAPVLVLHGTNDRVVPIAFGERLFALANEPKRLVRIPGGGHSDLDAFGAQAVTRPFIAEAARCQARIAWIDDWREREFGVYCTDVSASGEPWRPGNTEQFVLSQPAGDRERRRCDRSRRTNHD